ncbi:TPA: hypothetical protein ACOJQP_003233 [Vibrio harveyi]|uniref:hypothetical protein n=1 Tax=Vibrio harveyi TaxID=669 RepID=UPI003909922E
MTEKNLNQLFAGMKSTVSNYKPTGRKRGRPTDRQKIEPYWKGGRSAEWAAMCLKFPIEKIEHYYREFEKGE